MNSADDSLKPAPRSSPQTLTLRLTGIGHVPSKKNHHFPLKNGGLGIDKSVKKRMAILESAILSALFSSCLTTENETHSECLKRLRTLLSGLSDDSVREIPAGSWDVRHVPKGEEGVQIQIKKLM